MKTNKPSAALAIDLGASSGRHLVRLFAESGHEDVEVYRFENHMDSVDGHLVWDIDRIWNHIKAGISVACRRYPEIRSIGIDTWGCDYVLLRGDQEIRPVFAYRDSRTETACEIVKTLIADDELYAKTGCQFQPFNTLYQLIADQKSGRLAEATDFLMLPEYFFWKLTHIKLHEYTNATTTGMVNARKKAYDLDLISALGLPTRLFGELTFPGHSEPIASELKEEWGLRADAILVATHDTASAVEGIDMPMKSLYLSSGTWSLLGVKLTHPVLTSDARKRNFSNEGGIGYYRFQKNIMGLWIIQQLKEELKSASFEEMARLAEASSYSSTFDVNANGLLSPTSMKNAVLNVLKETGNNLPESDGDLINSVFLSLAESYRNAVNELEQITGLSFEGIHVFGGGAKNQYLNGLIEKAVQKKVFSHPIEASASGSFKIQEETLFQGTKPFIL